MVTFIEKLDSLLTNVSPDKRELGVKIFALVLEQIPTDLLNAQQVELISTFFINKLKDHHKVMNVIFIYNNISPEYHIFKVIPPTIKGLISVVQLKHFPPEQIPILLTTMVDNIACQQQQQGDRYNIYKLFEILLESFATGKQLLMMNLYLINIIFIFRINLNGFKFHLWNNIINRWGKGSKKFNVFI